MIGQTATQPFGISLDGIQFEIWAIDQKCRE
jgi:hypothetical protein